MVAVVGDFTAAVEADSTVARQEVFMVAAEVTMATAADMLTSVTMAVAITVGADTTDTMVATAGAADMDGVGGIHATVGAGDGVLALGGRIGIGDGDIRMTTMDTALGITLPTLTTTRMIVLRDTHALLTETTTRRHRIPAPNPGLTPRNLGDPR